MFSKINFLILNFIVSFCFLFSNQIIGQQFKVLIISETAGWNHQSIANGISAINELALLHDFEVVRQQNFQKITDESLKGFDAVIFLNTSGNIFDNQEQSAFERFIRSGKGYVGIHAAATTEYGWEWYTKLVGRMFHIHPLIQTAKLKIIDHNFLGLEDFSNTLLWSDEWYVLGEEKSINLNYLMTVDEGTYNPVVTWKNRDPDANGNMLDRNGRGMGAIHPISWYHEFDGGRSFYTALGHIEKSYENKWFLEHLYGGIYYAATGRGIEKN